MVREPILAMWKADIDGQGGPLELPLHPSHHVKSSTPYQRLDAHDESPQLPNGYYVMFWTALIPPLFHYRMKNSYRQYKQQIS